MAWGAERARLRLASQQRGDEEGHDQQKQIQTNEDEKASAHAIDDACPCSPEPYSARDDTDRSEDGGEEEDPDQRLVLAMSSRRLVLLSARKA